MERRNTLNTKELILDRIAHNDVLFCGDSEYDIRNTLENVLGISPERAEVFNHQFDTEKVFFRIVNDNTYPVDFNDADEVNMLLFNKTTILNAWNLEQMIERFDNMSFEELVAYAMKDIKAYICMNNMDSDEARRAFAAACELADGFGCHDDEYDSTFAYATSLTNSRYAYLFRSQSGELDASTGLGTTHKNHPGIHYVFPIWLLAAKYTEEETQSASGFDDLFET